MVISIHSLVKRETRILFLCISMNLNFNPLPRKEGDMPLDSLAPQHSIISIHSLVKRETACQVLDILSNFISIHSLVKRETASEYLDSITFGHFNPLPRKEGDRRKFDFFGNVEISIHSLVKRETRQPKMVKLGANKFQSTPS